MIRECAIGFLHDERSLTAVQEDARRTFAFAGQQPGFQTADNIGQHRVIVAFSECQIEFDPEPVVHSGEGLQTRRQKLIPEAVVFCIASVQLCGLITSETSKFRMRVRSDEQLRVGFDRLERTLCILYGIFRRLELSAERTQLFLRLVIACCDLRQRCQLRIQQDAPLFQLGQLHHCGLIFRQLADKFVEARQLGH